MGQRNMLCTGQMIDLEMDQQVQGYLCPEPYFLVGGRSNFLQPNVCTISRASGSMGSHDVHNLSEHYENSMFYGRMQYSGFQDHHPSLNLDLGVANSSNFYNSFLSPASGSGHLPVPLNHGSPDQLLSSSNYGVVGVSDNYQRNCLFMDGIEGSCKRKIAEGFPENFQYYNASAAGSSSMVVPLNTRHNDGVALGDGASTTLPHYRASGTLSLVESGSQRSIRNGSGATRLDPVQVHTHNPFVQGSYMGQPFYVASTQWLDQQSSRNSNDGVASAWTQTPAIAYTHGYMDSGNMNAQRYHETASNRNCTSFLNPPAINHQHYMHLPPPYMQGMRGLNMNFYPQVAAASYHVSTNNGINNNMNTSMHGLERECRHLGSVPPTGFSIYRSHQEGVMHEATLRYPNLPHLRMLPTDEVAVLEFPEFYETGNFVDNHRDLRLDIENMSYEELLALGERIGNVNNGLTKEIITSQLKTRKYVSSATSSNMVEAASEEREAYSCIICQAEYRNQETIGTLDCGHEYHADCIKDWLLVKNICAICKCEALSIDRKDE